MKYSYLEIKASGLKQNILANANNLAILKNLMMVSYTAETAGAAAS